MKSGPHSAGDQLDPPAAPLLLIHSRITVRPRTSLSGRSRGRRTLSGLLAMIICIAGCLSSPKSRVVLPGRHSVRSDQLLVLSDFKLASDHKLIAELNEVRQEVASTLELPLQGDSVVVYLFADESIYRQYLTAVFPRLPPRRAYFVGTARQLAVYTYWGERIQDDLRHEFTHGLLHSEIRDVPLWLDEGLAEYFEVTPDSPQRLNLDHVRQLSAAVENGWRPSMERLERLESVTHMQKIDYQESWAWTHYLLHDSSESRAVLLEYLAQLRQDKSTAPLSTYLARQLPDGKAQFASYLRALGAQASAAEIMEDSKVRVATGTSH